MTPAATRSADPKHPGHYLVYANSLVFNDGTGPTGDANQSGMAVNVSKFLRGMGAAEIRALILEAASSRTAAWRIAPNGFLVTEVNLGRAIGTDVDGNVATALKIVAQGDGSVVTAFPLKWPP